jgi:predicted amidohydrolase
MHIAMLSITEAGATVAYRKMWLGGAEADRFAPGTAPAAIEVDTWRLGLAICKDTGVRQHAAATAALGIDAYVAGVVEAAADRDVLVERARRISIDHRVWVGVASFAGSTGGGYAQTAGRSAIWAPGGRCVAQAGRGWPDDPGRPHPPGPATR